MRFDHLRDVHFPNVHGRSYKRPAEKGQVLMTDLMPKAPKKDEEKDIDLMSKAKKKMKKMKKMKKRMKKMKKRIWTQRTLMKKMIQQIFS